MGMVILQVVKTGERLGSKALLALKQMIYNKSQNGLVNNFSTKALS